MEDAAASNLCLAQCANIPAAHGKTELQQGKRSRTGTGKEILPDVCTACLCQDERRYCFSIDYISEYKNISGTQSCRLPLVQMDYL